MKPVVKIFTIIFLFFVLSVSAQVVHKTKTGKKYHTGECSYLTKSNIEISLKDAIAEDLTPCKKCEPPIALKTSSTKKEIKKATDTKPKTSATVKCQAKTKKGKQCKRNASASSKNCWQHK